LANLANRFLFVFSVQFDGEKPDKITRGASACNDDKVSSGETPLFLLTAEPMSIQNGHPTSVATRNCAMSFEASAD
jgi:hypothetical protein